MPPKARVPKGKLHVLAPEIPVGFKFTDTRKKEFVLGKQFATGGFGRIYTCNEVGKKEQLCVKIEPSENGPLFVEINVFQRALKLDLIQDYCKEKKVKSVGVPYMISGGIFDYKDMKLRYLIMPKYATSLEAIREKTGKLDDVAALSVAKATVRSLDYLNSKNYTHGDIKSANILLPSPSDWDGAVLVDYGLARLATSNEEKADKKRAHNGTAIFTSLDAHRGYQPSYRGDIEILVYNIVYWITGKLPWQAQESDPAAVQKGKEIWEKNPEKEIADEVGAAIGTPLASIYRLALKTGYTAFVDTVSVLKLLDTALSACKKTSTTKKTPSSAATKAKVTVPRRASKRAEVVDEDEEEEEAPVPKVTSRGRKQIIVSSEEDEDNSPVVKKATSSRAAASRKKKVVVSDEDEEEEEYFTPATKKASSSRLPSTARAGSEVSSSISREERLRKRTASVEPPSISSPTRKPSETKKSRPIPGLFNRVAPSMKKGIKEESEDNEEGEEEEDDENDSADTDDSSRSGVGSAVKASKDELRRTVPGMRNLAKGRRSVIIAQIARKHAK